MDLGKFLGGFGNAAATYATGVGQILTGNLGGAWQTAQKNPYATSRPTTPAPRPNPPAPQRSAPPASSGMDSGTAAMIAAMNRQTAELRRQIDSMPKLPVYNTADAWARAQSKAASSVNPVYQDKLNNKLAEFQAGIRQKTEETTRGKEALSTKLAQDIEDIAINRQRTGEDVNAKIAESLYQEGRFQDLEGTQFDRENRQARTELAQAGLTQSGLGAQQLEDAELGRNETSADQVRTFKNEQQAQELFKTRTFEDLSKSETRKTQLTDVQKKDLDITLSNYIENTNIAETQYRWQNEAERLDALFGATTNAYNTDIRNFLASLQGKARPQDIALASQVYRTY